MDNNGGMKVSAMFSPKDVVCGVTGVARDDCLAMLVRTLEQNGAIKKFGPVFDAVMAREALGSTIVAPGLAVPHARIEELSGPVMALAVSPEGIGYGAKGERVHVVVLILTGVAPGEYLQVLAAVARMFSDASVIEKVAWLATPEKVWELFDKGAAVLPEFVTAADMMRRRVVALHHTDTLAQAIDAFIRDDLQEIPILDDDDDLAGMVTEDEILKLCMPEYILWLEDLGPILRFEPFSEVLRDERTTRLAEIMSREFVTVSEETPAIQVAREFMREGVNKVFVVRGKKLAGVITVSHFFARVFRG